jgi:hypothetical protein
MVVSSVIATLLGVLLGLRFKVLIVVPANFVAVVIAAVGGTVQGDSITWLVLTALAAVASLQVGYIAGCTLRVLLAATRAGTKDGSHLRLVYSADVSSTNGPYAPRQKSNREELDRRSAAQVASFFKT